MPTVLASAPCCGRRVDAKQRFSAGSETSPRTEHRQRTDRSRATASKGAEQSSSWESVIEEEGKTHLEHKLLEEEESALVLDLLPDLRQGGRKKQSSAHRTYASERGRRAPSTRKAGGALGVTPGNPPARKRSRLRCSCYCAGTDHTCAARRRTARGEQGKSIPQGHPGFPTSPLRTL